MTLEHINTSSGKEYSFRTWCADDIINCNPSSEAVSVAHYLAQTRIGGMITQIENYELILLMPPDRIAAEDLVEVLERINKENVYQVIIICYQYMPAINFALMNSLEEYWQGIQNSVDICTSVGFIDTTPFHISLGNTDAVWLVYDNFGADKLLQLRNLKHHLKSLIQVTGYSLAQIPDCLKNAEKTVCKGAVI